MNTEINNVLGTLNHFEGQFITFRKCILKNFNYGFFLFFFLVYTVRKQMDEKVLQSVLLGNIWIIFDFFPWTLQFTGHWFQSDLAAALSLAFFRTWQGIIYSCHLLFSFQIHFLASVRQKQVFCFRNTFGWRWTHTVLHSNGQASKQTA